jgi:hypothetical protein
MQQLLHQRHQQRRQQTQQRQPHRQQQVPKKKKNASANRTLPQKLRYPVTDRAFLLPQKSRRLRRFFYARTKRGRSDAKTAKCAGATKRCSIERETEFFDWVECEFSLSS